MLASSVLPVEVVDVVETGAVTGAVTGSAVKVVAVVVVVADVETVAETEAGAHLAQTVSKLWMLTTNLPSRRSHKAPNRQSQQSTPQCN
jgi:hypothetical protein